MDSVKHIGDGGVKIIQTQVNLFNNLLLPEFDFYFTKGIDRIPLDQGGGAREPREQEGGELLGRVQGEGDRVREEQHQLRDQAEVYESRLNFEVCCI